MKNVKDDVVYVLRKVSESDPWFRCTRGEKMEAPDWKANKESGHGLHGLEWGRGDSNLDYYGELFIVLKVRKSDGYVDLSDHVKFRKGDVVMVTKDGSKAIEYIKGKAAEHGVVLSGVNYDYSTDQMCDQGDDSTSRQGNWSISIQGHRSASTQRDYSASKQGNRSTSEQGNGSTSSQGNESISIQGHDSVSIQGHRSTSRQGNRGTSNQWGGSTNWQGDDSTSEHGAYSASIQGCRSTSNQESGCTSVQGNGGVSIIHGDSHVYRALGAKSRIVMFPNERPKGRFGDMRVYKQGWDYKKNETVYITDSKITKRYTGVGEVKELENHEVFVFGSNMAGKHIGGAAKTALDKLGAEDGVGEGSYGRSYAFPILDEDLKKRSVEDLRESVGKLVKSACNNSTTIFLLTKVGCGTAGYKEDDMKKLFDITKLPANIVLPKDWYTN